MTLEQIRKMHEQRPFQRFTLVLADGPRVPVRSPETLSHPGGGRSIIVWERPEQWRIIDLLLVTCLAVDAGRAHRNGKSHNGRGKK